MSALITGIQKHTLSNGLTVLLCPTQRVDLACVLTWVNTGYFHEPDELGGVSHLIEHLLFKGTAKRGVGEIARQTKELGGYLNASTTYDHTTYHTMVPSSAIMEALDIQSDVFMNPLFDPAEIEKEKKVVYQEMRRKLDQPHAFAREKLFELAFDRHRIRRWRIGSEETLAGFSSEAIRAFYDQNYTPANSTVVICGKFDSSQVLDQVEKKYGAMQSRQLVRQEGPTEPSQRQPKMVRLRGDLSQVIVKMGFHTVPMFHADYAALSCLNILLGKGRSSRLYKSIKDEKQYVHGIGSSQFAFGDIGFFSIEAEAKPESIARAEEEIWTEIDRVSKEPPSAQEVHKIRSIIESGFFREKEDIMGQAYSLAYFESLGGYEKMSDHVQALRGQTSEGMVAVAEKYFQFPNMSLLEYVPQELGMGAEMGNRLESLSKRVTKRQGESVGVGIPPTVSPTSDLTWSFETQASGKYPVEKIRLDSGGTLLYQYSPGVPLVSMHAYFPGGRLDESEKNCGITLLLLKNTLKGTENRTADEIFFELESMGTSIQVESTADHFGYATSALTKDFEKNMAILADVMLHPVFPASELEKEKTTTLSNIHRIRDDMFHYPIELFYKSLYGMHSYGLPRNGLEGSVSHLTREDLLDWYSQVFSWNKLVITVVGNISKDEVLASIKDHFAFAQDADPVSIAQVYPFVGPKGITEKVETRQKNQTAVALGFQGVSFHDPRYYALEIIRNIFSGMGGRLFTRMRETLPLAYTVTAFNLGLFRGGAFFVYFACAPKHEQDCKMILFDELKKMRAEHVSPKELKMAKAFTIGSHEMSLQTNSMVGFSLAHHYLGSGNVDRMNDYVRRIEEVTPELLRKTAQEIFNLDHFSCGVVKGSL